MKLHEDALPEATKALWAKLKNETALTGALLVGGTALSIRIGHRQSEDLDFSFPTEKLPGGNLRSLLRIFPDWKPNDNAAAYDEFLNAGMSLHDYLRDFISEHGVKITFFAEDRSVWPLIRASSKPGPKLATIREIFALKSLVCAKRSSSRDWLDLYVLMKGHRFTMHDVESAFRKADRLANFDIAINRLLSGITDATDAGFHSLLPNPPSVGELAEFFREACDNYMREKSALALKNSRARK
jgi:Nucleotidyl transferase AbiEii toxin, Type IV TA system